MKKIRKVINSTGLNFTRILIVLFFAFPTISFIIAIKLLL